MWWLALTKARQNFDKFSGFDQSILFRGPKIETFRGQCSDEKLQEKIIEVKESRVTSRCELREL